MNTSRDPVALIVTGFHRSGTSMLMQALKGAGLVIGNDLLPPGASNPDGHFEDRAIVRLHDTILNEQQGCWHSPPQDTSSISEEHTSTLSNILEPYLAQPSPWGFKDPRTCLFLPWWQAQLTQYRQVFIYRNPLDCVRSLQTRQAQELVYRPQRNASAVFFWDDPDKALALWVRYNQAILDATRSAPDKTLLVSYEALVAGFPIIECANRQLNLTLNTRSDTRVRPQKPASGRSPKQPFGLSLDALDKAHEILLCLNRIAIEHQGQWANRKVPGTLLITENTGSAVSAQAQQTRDRLQRMQLWQDNDSAHPIEHLQTKPVAVTPTDSAPDSDALETIFAQPADVFTQVDQLRESGKHQQADDMVVQQATAFPDDCLLNITAGHIWLSRDSLEKAEQHFRQAHSNAPRNKVPPMQLGIIARRCGDHASACDWFALSIERDQDNPGLHALLAQSQQNLGHVAQALDVTRQGLVHAPEDQKLLLLEAELLLAERKPDVALLRIQHVLTLYPECPTASKLHYRALAAQPGTQRDDSLPWFYLAVYRSMQSQSGYCKHLERALASLDITTGTALRAQVHVELDRIHHAVLTCTASTDPASQSIDGA